MEIIKNLKAARNYKDNIGIRIYIFYFLMKLDVLKLLNKRSDKLLSCTFLNQVLVGYSYKTIKFLFCEVFLTSDYSFSSSKKSPVIIDCGANVGISIAYFKHLYPKSIIHAYELSPYSYKALQELVRLNRYTDVHLYNVALANKSGEVEFYSDGAMGSTRASLYKNRSGNLPTLVKSQQLSQYITQFGTVDFVKMDVEGAEVLILEDLSESKQLERIGEMVIEYHHNIEGVKSDFSGFLNKFQNAGFMYKLKGNYNESKNYQDILVRLKKVENG